MVFIVISHYSVHGSIKSMDLEFGFNKFLIDSTNYGLIEKYVFKNIINRINSCADSIYSRLLSIIDKSYTIEQ